MTAMWLNVAQMTGAGRILQDAFAEKFPDGAHWIDVLAWRKRCRAKKYDWAWIDTNHPPFTDIHRSLVHVQKTSVWDCNPRSFEWRFVAKRQNESPSITAGATPVALTDLVVATYSNPGDLVFDPMMGTGTALVSALWAGRRAAGLEIEEERYGRAIENLHLAVEKGTSNAFTVGLGSALDGDAMRIGRDANLVFIDPPWGETRNDSHSSSLGWNKTAFAPYSGEERTTPRSRRKRNNIGNLKLAGQMDAMSAIYATCYSLAVPKAYLVITARDYRKNNEQIPFTALTIKTAIDAGWILYDRAIAVLNRASHFQHLNSQRHDHLLPVHQEVLIFRKG